MCMCVRSWAAVAFAFKVVNKDIVLKDKSNNFTINNVSLSTTLCRLKNASDIHTRSKSQLYPQMQGALTNS